MQGVLYDIFDRPVDVGDVVVASRPSGTGSSEVNLCRVLKITNTSVSFRILNQDRSDQQPINKWDNPGFHVQKGRNDKCKKVFLLEKI